MTYQEANALVDDFSFVYKGKSISKEMLIECREVIHKALEKQIPKKIKISEYEPFGFFYFCPNCGVNIENRLYKQKCCGNCGQALGWEGVK